MYYQNFIIGYYTTLLAKKQQFLQNILNDKIFMYEIKIKKNP
jgi:hypothetical protein